MAITAGILRPDRGVIHLAGPEDAARLEETFDALSASAPDVTRIRAAEILRRVLNTQPLEDGPLRRP